MKLHHFIVVLVFAFIWVSPVYAQQSAEQLYQSGLYKEEIKGELAAAIKIYETIINKHPENRSVAAKSLLHFGICKERLGMKEATVAYQKVINSYPEQTEAVKAARDKLSALQRVQALVEKADDVLKLTKIYENAEKIFGFLSPDGKKLALIGGEGDIWVRQVDSGKEMRLTSTPNFKWWCSWSPDGETIAYLDVLNVLYVVPAKGGEPKPLIVPDSDFIKKGNSAQMTGWTKDSQMIICQVSGRGLCAIPLSGGEWKDLFKFTDPKQEEAFREMTLSPNGKFIAYDSKKSGNSDIYIMPTNGGQSIQITNHPASDGPPSWSFDGKWISFLSTRSGDSEIWVIGISPDGHPQGEPFQVFRDLPFKNSFFNWINDGKIGISMNPTIQNVFISDLETGKETQLTNILTEERHPRWSPDGRQIAFLSYRDNKPNLWVIPSGGGVAKKVTLNVPNPDGSCYLTRPSWLPDGKSLAFGGFFGKDHGIWIVPSGGGVPQLKKFDFEVGNTFCDVSPDGLYIAFNVIGLEKGDSIKGSRTYGNGIFVVPFKGGEPKRMTKTEKNGLSFSSPRWSPDGKLIAFVSTNRLDKNEGKESKEIWVCGFPDGEPKPITKKMAGNLNFLSWAPDKKTIIFNNGSQIYSVPAEGGEVKKMNIEGDMPDFSPDGKKIVYVKNKSKVECWLVENFLPKESDKLILSSKGFGGLVTRRILADASGVDGVLTADGKYISHIDGETGDLVQFEVASGQKNRIKNRGPWTDNALDHQVFSRDGKQIAYDVESSDPNTKDWLYQVRITNLDGSGLRTIYSQKDSLVWPLDWTPDAGAVLVLREGNKADELVLISIADGSVRVLRSGSGFERPSFSPDGRFIAFNWEDIFLMTADGLNEVVVAGHSAKDRLLGWTPDGRSLVFRSDRSGTWDLWTVRITGGKQQGEPELMKKDFGYDTKVLGFAPDGSFYYKTDTPLGGLYSGEVDLETGKVLVSPAPVSTRYISQPRQLTWSPDGRNLLYISNWGWGPGQDILTIRSVATGKERLLSGLGFVNQISWAPDSRSVIALGSGGIIRIDTETKGITKLGKPGLFPRLCPDGKTVVFAFGPIISKRNLDTGEESEVVNVGTGGTAQWYYDLSPDGREVVFQKDSTIKIVALNGGQPRELFHCLAKYYRMRWTGDGRYIIAQAATFGGSDVANTEIWRIPAQGGTPLKLDLSVPKLAYFTLNPDNRRFAFSVDEGSRSELWVMENFLPK